MGKKNGRIYRSFQEKYQEYSIYHSPILSVHFIDSLICIIWTMYILIQKRSIYNKILFYNYMPTTAIPAIFGKLFLGKKIYLEYEDGYFARKLFKPLKLLILINEKIGNHLISGAILVAKGLKSRVRTENIQIIPGIIDYELYDYFKSLPVKKDKKVFMYSGGLDEIRGIDIYLKVAEEIIERIEGNFEFWITGKGPLEPMVYEFTRKYPNKIYYKGFVSRERLLEIYDDVYVFLSLQKPDHKFSEVSSPSKVYEFISTGKFCVGLMDIAINFENYIYVNDLSTLKNVLIDFIKNEFYETKPIEKENFNITIFD